MKIPVAIIHAINLYFAVKGKGNGMFVVGGEKERCLSNLQAATRKYKINLTVVPGTIFLSKGKQSGRITGPLFYPPKRG